MYTDDSSTDDFINAGAGVHCESLYASTDPCETAFDGEIAAIYKALLQLQARLEHFLKVIFLKAFRAALQAIESQNEFRP